MFFENHRDWTCWLNAQVSTSQEYSWFKFASFCQRKKEDKWNATNPPCDLGCAAFTKCSQNRKIVTPFVLFAISVKMHEFYEWYVKWPLTEIHQITLNWSIPRLPMEKNPPPTLTLTLTRMWGIQAIRALHCIWTQPYPLPVWRWLVGTPTRNIILIIVKSK